MNTQQFASELDRAARAMGENRWSDAIADLRIVYEQAPDNVDAAGKLAFAFSREGRYRDALNVLEGLHKRQPEAPKWPYMIGYQHYEKKAWKEAITWFQKALRVRPGYIKALYRKGYAHVALGQENEAINTLTDCAKYWEKTSSDGQEQDRSIYGKAQFQLGKLLLKKGLSRKAAQHLEIAVRIDSQNHDFLYELGQCHLRNDRLDEALRVFEAADRIKPGTDYIIDRLAQTYARNGEYATAEHVYERIPEHRRRHFVSQHLGMMYVDCRQYEKAIPHLEAALRKQQENHNIHYALGRAHEALGQFRKAHASYTRAVDYRRTNFNLEFKEAEEASKRTSELVEESASSEETNNPNMGVVESYDDARGFGFIVTDSHERIFFHISKVAGGQKPRRGCSVLFSSESSPKGLRAVHVDLLIGNQTSASKTQTQQLC